MAQFAANRLDANAMSPLARKFREGFA